MYRNSVPSLMNICLDYVSLNIKSVESFVDFPDIVGKQIFDETKKKNKLSLLEPDGYLIL